MRYLWLDEYLLHKRGVTRDFQPVWQWTRYHIGGKMFAAVCLDNAGTPYYINLKLEPEESDFFSAGSTKISCPATIPTSGVGSRCAPMAPCRTSCCGVCWTGPTAWCWPE